MSINRMPMMISIRRLVIMMLLVVMTFAEMRTSPVVVMTFAEMRTSPVMENFANFMIHMF